MRRYTDTLRRCGRDPLHPVSLTTTPPTVRYGWTLLAVLLLGLTVLRLVVRSNLDIDLHYDEAQYAVWSMQPDWGYYSKPPLIAWAIAAARGVCGDSAFCVRLPSAIAFTVTPLLVFALGRELWPYRPSVAWLGAGLFTLAPLTNFYALFMTTDSLLLLCWSAALLVLVRAIRLGGGWWPLLGIALGFGLLAKYTMGIFAVSSVMVLWLMPQLRRVLVLPGPWMALFIAVLMFAPNLWWNAVHDFPTWHHTAEIAQIDRAGNGLGGLFEFIGAQIVIFGPLAFAAAAYSVRRGLQAPVAPTDIGPGQAMPIPALRFLVCFAVPFLVIICVQAGLSRAFANWAAPAYVAGSLLAASALLATRLRWLIAAALGTSLLLSALAYGHEALARAAGLNWEGPLHEVRGWSKLGRQVDALAQQHHATLVLDDRKLASEMGFYAGTSGRTLRIWNPTGARQNQFQMTRDLRDLPKRDGAFLVISRRELQPALSAAFAEVTPLPVELSMSSGHRTTPLRVWLARDFSAYR